MKSLDFLSPNLFYFRKLIGIPRKTRRISSTKKRVVKKEGKAATKAKIKKPKVERNKSKFSIRKVPFRRY